MPRYCEYSGCNALARFRLRGDGRAGKDRAVCDMHHDLILSDSSEWLFLDPLLQSVYANMPREQWFIPIEVPDGRT